jgi:hypothetical protein
LGFLFPAIYICHRLARRCNFFHKKKETDIPLGTHNYLNVDSPDSDNKQFEFYFCVDAIVSTERETPTMVPRKVSSSKEHVKPVDHVPNFSVIKPGRRSVLYTQPKKSRANPIPSKPFKSDRCSENILNQYFNDLGLNKIYFNFDYNKCYCSICYDSTNPDFIRISNSIYTIPRGWLRFGLHVDQAFASAEHIFKQWHTTFYGTSKDKLEWILRNRFIPLPGDALLSGEIFTTHLPDKHHVYTSPSIHYASLSHLSPNHTTKINNEWYDVQVVLECKQNPMEIIKQCGCRRDVCRIIPNDKIEWKTNQRSSVVPYGLLIRTRKHRCIRKCAHIHY